MEIIIKKVINLIIITRVPRRGVNNFLITKVILKF